MDLMHAANQWSFRPDDERFESLESLLADRRAMRAGSTERKLATDKIIIASDGTEVVITGQSGQSARLTHHAFGQLAVRAGAPAGYLRSLPSALAASCLTEGMAKRTDAGADDRALIYANGVGPIVRAVTSNKYSRVWDESLVSRTVDLQDDGWRVPPARPVRSGQKGTRTATADDVLSFGSHASLGIKVGDAVAPAGIYASDHDLFVFMVDDTRRIQTPSGELSRGFFLWNSEVGAASFGITTFYFDAVCGNHIVWGASDVREIRVRHVGSANERAFSGVNVQLRSFANAATHTEEARLLRAAQITIAGTKEDVVSAIFGKRLPGLTKSLLDRAYDVAAATPRYGNPASPWGMVCGLTDASQSTSYADDRALIDTSAGKILDTF